MTNHEMVIRQAVRDDASLLSRLGARTFRETFAADNSAGDMEAYCATAFTPERVGEELADPQAVFLVVERNGEAVGYAKLYAGDAPDEVTGPRPYELVRLYVTAACIGQGVGAVLMQACLAQAKERGFQTVWLGVWEHNLRAQAFYRKGGFVPVGSHVFQLGEDAQTDFLLQKTPLD